MAACTTNLHFIILWFPSICHRELALLTLYLRRWITCLHLNTIPIGSSSRRHSLARRRCTWRPLALSAPRILACPIPGVIPWTSLTMPRRSWSEITDQFGSSVIPSSCLLLKRVFVDTPSTLAIFVHGKWSSRRYAICCLDIIYLGRPLLPDAECLSTLHIGRSCVHRSSCSSAAASKWLLSILRLLVTVRKSLLNATIPGSSDSLELSTMMESDSHVSSRRRSITWKRSKVTLSPASKHTSTSESNCRTASKNEIRFGLFRMFDISERKQH